MHSDPLSVVVFRFASGLGVVFIIGLLAFRLAVFDPSTLAFHCLTTGGLVAGILALLRSDRMSQAIAVAVGFALLRLGFLQSQGWASVVADTFLVGGAFVVSLIFDLLARDGIRFGKFLVLGPLLGGIYLAITPLAEFQNLMMTQWEATLMRYVFLGVVIGDAVGFGAEVADLLIPRLRGETG